MASQLGTSLARLDAIVRDAIALLASLLLLPAAASAGGGPENVLLVINPASENSQEIANYYTRWRRIPACNVLELPWRGEVGETNGKEFREGLLAPILETIEKRGLAPQIDYIVYSCDFPYAVDLRGELHDRQTALSRVAAVGSITSLTYLTGMVVGQDARTVTLTLNRYGDRSRVADWSSVGFRHDQAWGPGGRPTDDGPRYYLSTMLAVTTKAGTSVDEALDYLRRAVLSDGTQPGGTIYYMNNAKDRLRSGPRDGRFELAARTLRSMGVNAEVVFDVLPKNKPDVQGAMIGAAKFDWASSGSRIRPGAFCDHLTSLGGVMKVPTHQTSLAEFLRHGAAGACGTVWEPTNHPAKFPDSMMHVHYARGCTLAEAFYRSVSAPFQQLLVGDPLCRPWATIPTVSVEGVKPGQTVNGILDILPSAQVASGDSIGQFRLFVDGRLVDQRTPGQTFRLDTNRLADGWHELRVVAIESSAVASQGRILVDVTVDNQGRTCRLTADPSPRVGGRQPIVLRAQSPGSRGVMIYHNRHLLGQFAGEQGQITVEPKELGPGPVRVFAIGLGDGRTSGHVVSPPVDLDLGRWSPQLN